MFMLGPIGFLLPWLLAGLVALPILWILLRAVPPAPIRRRFPGVALLLGLKDDESQTDKTPWWLLLLRMLAVAACIVGFAGPVLNPQTERSGEGPLLVLMDGTWADAGDWPRRLDRVGALLEEAKRGGRPAAVALLTDLPAGDLQFQAADVWESKVQGLTPNPWEPDPSAITHWIETVEQPSFDTYWMSDGLARDSRTSLLQWLESKGELRVFEGPRPVLALRPATFDAGVVRIPVVRALAAEAVTVTVTALGLDPVGTERELARAEGTLADGALETVVELSLPSELRNRITRFEISGQRSAGAVTLTDDALKRREVALIAGRDDREGLELLSPLHYLRQALEPTADLIDGTIEDILLANPDAIVLADVAKLTELETQGLVDWIDRGGLLLRFAGSSMAAADLGRDGEDPLLPVRLRAGGRSVGGAMSWGEPKTLRPFSQESPFFGLPVPDDVRVTAQVVAQPDPSLASRVIAALEDGTPLVTRKRIGQGQVVLFHVTANAEWSTLPLSGLFVQMLERLAISTRPAEPLAEDLAGTVWQADKVLDAFGQIGDAGVVAGIAGERLVSGELGADMPPGLYAGADRRIAVNVIGRETGLAAAVWPPRIAVEGLNVAAETALKGSVLTVAMILLMADVLASLWLSGRLHKPRAGITALALLVLLVPPEGRAQSGDAFAIEATTEVVLAHILTGNAEVDRIADAGLRGLSEVIFSRTSIEPAQPMAIDLETDELSFFPFLYWPITPDQPSLSPEAYSKLNRYLRTGGMILFDTRDADVARFGGNSPNGKMLQTLARPLDIPPLEPLPEDHVLTRTFYLLQDFPGRYDSRDIWVEAAPADAQKIEGMPFRNLNDGVTPVVIGGNDWAAAWAVDTAGNRMFQVGRGYAGERQREIAFRFGVNLVMHVLTGNYKSDQVHVPALLDRLGQ